MKLCPECLLCLRRVRTASCELRHGFSGAALWGHGQQLWLRQRPPQWPGQCLRGGEIRWHATLAERAHAPPSPEGHGYEQELQGALPAMAEPALKETVKHTDRQKENSQQADIISGRPTLGALRQGRRARARSPYLSRSSRFLGLACLGGPLPLLRLGHRGDNLDCSRSRAERPCCSVLLLGRSPTLKLPASAWRALLGSGPHLRLGESRPRRSSANSGMPTLHWRITFLQLPGFELEGLSLGEALL